MMAKTDANTAAPIRAASGWCAVCKKENAPTSPKPRKGRPKRLRTIGPSLDGVVTSYFIIGDSGAGSASKLQAQKLTRGTRPLGAGRESGLAQAHQHLERNILHRDRCAGLDEVRFRTAHSRFQVAVGLIER